VAWKGFNWHSGIKTPKDASIEYAGFSVWLKGDVNGNAFPSARGPMPVRLPAPAARKPSGRCKERRRHVADATHAKLTGTW